MRNEKIKTVLSNGVTVTTFETKEWYTTTISLEGKIVHETDLGDSFYIVIVRHLKLVRLAFLGKFGSHDMREQETSLIGKIRKWMETGLF